MLNPHFVRPLAHTIVLTLAGLAASCVNPNPGAAGRFCVADENELQAGVGELTTTLVESVDPSSARTPPPEFDACAAGIETRGEFLDENSQHVWLAVHAHVNQQPLLAEDFLGDAVGAQLHAVREPESATTGTLSLLKGADPFLVLQVGGRLEDAETGTVPLSTGAPSSLPTPSRCSTATEVGIVVLTDEGPKTFGSGDGGEVIVGGATFSLMNFASATIVRHDSCGGNAEGAAFNWLLWEGTM